MGLSLKQRLSTDQLCKDAPNSPQVNALLIVLVAQDDFRCTVPPCHHVLGQHVIETTLELVNGNNVSKINTSELVNGLYFVNLNTANGAITRKLVIKK